MPAHWREWTAIGPPEDEVGRELPVRRCLCRNRTAAAWLMTLTVYSTGFTVEVGGYFRPGEVGHRRDWFGYRLGVTLSDGRQATSLLRPARRGRGCI
jgi:hypothetical protein